MNTEHQQNPVAVIVSRIVERDDIERARLVVEIERSRAAGSEGWQDAADTRENGIDWRRFWINFSEKYPGASAFAPFALGMYVYLLLNWIFGS